MRVLGLDPGYAIVGYGLVEGEGQNLAPVTFGAITTEAHTAFEDRLVEIYTDMQEILATFQPQVMAIESLFYTSNQKTVIAVAEARGVILLAAKQAAVPVFEYTPLQVKQSVAGYGKATKRQVQEMTRRLLQLKAVPKPDDAADALALAICHLHSARSLRFGKTETRRQQMGYY
ncbi:MAG: crossover junction endodeoxyribonuclease RuvC [Oscillospiraceae bacterium]